jgi:hypothetical protein
MAAVDSTMTKVKRLPGEKKFAALGGLRYFSPSH